MGTLTITTDAAQDARILAAFKDKFLMVDNPTQAEIKAWVINQIKSVVIDYERRVAANLAAASIEPFEPN